MQIVLLIFGFFFTIFVYIVKGIIYILNNALLTDFVLTALYIGVGVCFDLYHLIWWQSLIIALLSGAAVTLAVAKLKYIRLFLLIGLGTFWGYEVFFKFAESVTRYLFFKFSYTNDTAVFTVALITNIAYMIHHTYSGITLGNKYFGKPLNILRPLEILLERVFKLPESGEVLLDSGELGDEYTTEPKKTDFLFYKKLEKNNKQAADDGFYGG